MANDSVPSADPRNIVSPVPPPPLPLPPAPPAPEGEAFPSMLECSYTMRPPQRAVYMDVRGLDGLFPKQVFEYSAVYRNIATPGEYTQFRKVRHPTSGGFIDRRAALSMVIDVPSEVQDKINTERRLQRLLPEEGLNEDDFAKYTATMSRMDDPRIDPSEVGANDIGNEMEDPVGVDLPRPPPQERSPAHFAARRRAAAARLQAAQSSSDEDDPPQLPTLNGMSARPTRGRGGRGGGILPRSLGGRGGGRGFRGRARHGPSHAQRAVAAQPVAAQQVAAPPEGGFLAVPGALPRALGAPVLEPREPGAPVPEPRALLVAAAVPALAGPDGEGAGRGPDGEGAGRIALASFISADGLRVRPGRREQALIALLQFAVSSSHQVPSNSSGSGIVLTLGHGNRTEWIRLNSELIFREDGPLGGFNPVRPERLCKWIKEAETCAKIYYGRDHSNDETGEEQEDLPAWTGPFFELFDAVSTHEGPRARAARLRRERRAVSRSLIGASAPLGYAEDGPARLREETSPNDGPPQMRQRTLGGVEVEGVDDTADLQEAPVRGGNYTSRRNRHLAEFSAGDNDPSTRFADIRASYTALRECTVLLSESINAAPAPPARSRMDIVREYAETERYLREAGPESQAFYNVALSELQEEMNKILGSAESGSAEMEE
jgi:hypothetical protein